MAAMDAGKQSTFDGRREPASVFFQEDVVSCAFGDLAAQVEKQHIVKAGLGWGFQGLRVERPVRGFMEEHGVPRIGALGGYARAHRLDACGDRARGQEFVSNLQVALAVEQEADLARLLITECRRVSQQRCLRLGAVAGESEVVSRIFEPVEMQFDERIPEPPEQALQKLEALRDAVAGRSKKLRLQETFAELADRIGVDDDTAADAHGAALAVELHGTNGYVEDGLLF